MKTIGCSLWAEKLGVSALGTALHTPGWLVIDWPLPWPPDVAEIEALAPLREVADTYGVRLQLCVPQETGTQQPQEESEVTLYWSGSADSGWFGGYTARSLCVPRGEVVSAAMQLLQRKSGGEAPASAGSEKRRILVCTHGSRDLCCGSLGAGLVSRMGAEPAVRRTSHLGGHRFAPTALFLPDGACWARVDQNLLRAVADKSVDPKTVLDRFRGCSGLPTGRVQAVDGHLLGEFGWEWLAWRRRGSLLAENLVRFEAESPDGDVRAWEAVVEEGRLLPVPECPIDGEDRLTASKYEPELVVREVIEIPA